MTPGADADGRGEGSGPAHPGRLGNPLDFMAGVHLRERAICALIDRIAGEGADHGADMDQVLSFLKVDLPLHLRDEEEDLFPLMVQRCRAEDEIDKIIGRLLADHEHAVVDTPQIIGILERVAAGSCALSAADRTALADYASHARRHLTVENAIILPIARARLSDADLDGLRLRMLRRRGTGKLTEPPGTD